MTLKKPLEKYENRRAKFSKLLEKQNKTLSKLSFLRFLVFAIGIVVSIKLYFVNYYIFTSSVLCTVVLFLYLVYIYMKVNKNLLYTSKLIEINEKAIKRFDGKWKDFKDCAEDFIDENHNFSYDLDLFGKGSLFQWTNEANTYCGRENLKSLLTEKPKGLNIVYLRQAAIIELAKKISFRQRLSVEGSLVKKNNYPIKELFEWLKEKNEDGLGEKSEMVIRALPLVTMFSFLPLLYKYIVFLLTNYADFKIAVPNFISIVPTYLPLIFILLQYILLKYRKDTRTKNIVIAEKYCEDVKLYRNIIKLIEKNKFESDYNMALYEALYNNKEISASKIIDKFAKICDSTRGRRGMLFPTLNVLFMLEYSWTFKLNKWRYEAGGDFETWLQVVGEFEALSSLSIISYDNPNWVMPKFIMDTSSFTAKNMGHPLLGEKRVCNNVQIKEPSAVMLVTGSNMSGKSTLMRTVGVNLVLSYAGAAVCADKFECKIMDLYSCMRINDNLDKNISSFYAEILKIKRIVEAVNKGKQVFFLLDEIFRGTNSRDRHTGAAILIRQLTREGNLGFVSTHDLELGEMESERNSKVKNYHFSEYYKDNEICFDYKLKPGISTTRNAVYLMKLAGIEIM